MSDKSRKVKNPLLSAAGAGFPFDNFNENALLMPVTPATSAVLRDDGEVDSFVGQDPSQIAPQLQVACNTQTSYNQQQSTEITALSTDEPKIVPTSQKQGYFSSILSSLPNLSLSSINATGSQSERPFDLHAGTPNSNPYAQHLHGNHPPTVLTSNCSADPGVLQHPSGFTETHGNLSAPPPQAPPTSLPPTGGPTVYRLGNQRRLKYAPPPDLTSDTPKQRSAPSIQQFSQQGIPDPATFLNPNVTQQQFSSSAQSFSPTASLLSGSQSPAQGRSLQGSFECSPVPTGPSSTVRSQTQSPSYLRGVPVSGPLDISPSTPQDICLRAPEPATPQNTPANSAFFPSFSSFPAAQHAIPQFGAKPNFFESDDRNSTYPATPKNSSGTTFEVSQPANTCPIVFSPDNIIEPKSEPSGNTFFAPISAAKVSEKLEHFLAEQKEDAAATTEITATNVLVEELIGSRSLNKIGEELVRNRSFDALAEVDLTKNESFSSVSLTSEEIVVQPEVQSTDLVDSIAGLAASDNSKLDTPTHGTIFNQFPQDLSQRSTESSQNINFFVEDPTEQNKTVSNYFVSAEKSSIPSFYDPSAFQKHPSSFFTSIPPSTTSSAYPENAEGNDRVQTTSSFQSIIGLSSRSEVPTFNPISSSASVPPQSLWSPDPNSFNVSNPIYEAPTQLAAPTFYNPAQFKTEPSCKLRGSDYSAPPGLSIGISSQSGYFSSTEVTSDYFAPPTPPMASAVPEPTGSATLSPVQMSVNPLGNYSTQDSALPALQQQAMGPTNKQMQYRPVYHHWFYRKEVETKVLWLPFSMQDSLKLEEIHNSNEITPETKVATDGGRYDVDILRRQRMPIYWSGSPAEVRRCSWFYKGPSESRYIPYEERTAARLEEEYKQAYLTDQWNRKIELSNGEYIIFHSATVQMHYLQAGSPELAASWGNSSGSEDGTYLQGTAGRPRMVKRGVDEFSIDEGEPEKVDHLLFLVHGIGSVCDLKFRNVEEVVDEFRSISLQLVQSHYRTACEHGIVNKIEVLPISWHTALHSEDTDKKIQAITLESIPKLRYFTNDTLLDILFYTSPIYCQTIMQTVGSEMNRLFSLFKERNPSFDGGIYVGGHSLGSLIMFDLLCHQKPPAQKSPDDDEASVISETGEEDSIGPIKPLPAPVLKRRLSRKISYMMGTAGTGQPYINYPQLNFHPKAFFALGSPIGMFVTVRGIDNLGKDFVLPTCPAFFNIFHPFDPVAYRIESLVNSEAHKYRPMLIPHHKGRKRMHLELKETMARVGADLKQKLMDSVKSTWNSVYQLTMFHRADNQTLEQEIDKVVEEQLQNSSKEPEQQSNDDGGSNLNVGKLNGGRRIDYVLQEAPFEYINEYIFALTSHVCYWESEDTMLLILKEIYGSMGIQADAQLPQQTMTIERAPVTSSSSSSVQSNSGLGLKSPLVGVDPTAPIGTKPPGPPPTSGFVRKS